MVENQNNICFLNISSTKLTTSNPSQSHGKKSKAKAKRRTLHGTNLMQISKNYCLLIWPWPYCLLIWPWPKF